MNQFLRKIGTPSTATKASEGKNWARGLLFMTLAALNTGKAALGTGKANQAAPGSEAALPASSTKSASSLSITIEFRDSSGKVRKDNVDIRPILDQVNKLLGKIPPEQRALLEPAKEKMVIMLALIQAQKYIDRDKAKTSESDIKKSPDYIKAEEEARINIWRGMLEKKERERIQGPAGKADIDAIIRALSKEKQITLIVVSMDPEKADRVKKAIERVEPSKKAAKFAELVMQIDKDQKAPQTITVSEEEGLFKGAQGQMIKAAAPGSVLIFSNSGKTIVVFVVEKGPIKDTNVRKKRLMAGIDERVQKGTNVERLKGVKVSMVGLDGKPVDLQGMLENPEQLKILTQTVLEELKAAAQAGKK
jgi:hypothetical protein